jgi:hypothetical protein
MVDLIEERQRRKAVESQAVQELTQKKLLSQRLAFALTEQLCARALARAIARWRSFLQRQQLAQLRLSLDELSNHISEVAASNDALEDKNTSLSTENEELRVLSLESIDLAKVKKKDAARDRR